MEVFSISGASSCPAGWVVTPNGNCGSSDAGSGYKHPSAVKLQEALNRAGVAVVVDGVVGKNTVAAVNTYLGLGLGISEVAEKATSLAVKVLEKALATGAKPVAPLKPGTVAPQLPAQPSVGKPFPTGGVLALMGLGLVVAGVGAYFAWIES